MTCPPKTGPVIMLDFDKALATGAAKKKSFSSALMLQKDFFFEVVHDMISCDQRYLRLITTTPLTIRIVDTIFVATVPLVRLSSSTAGKKRLKASA